jgi:diguanylate cyclase (GGDEF)-like protein
LIAAIETLEDITQQKRVESELQKANQKLQRFADLDGLTRIANRRKFDAHLNLWWKQLRREQLPLSLIMCDIDYFKLYNDTYGHLAGDDCLRAIAKAISLNFKRPADLVARYGGEEFAIILPNTDSTGVAGLCEVIRSKIEQLKMPHVLSSTSNYVTISVGASTIVPCDTYSPEFLVGTADKALYVAKESGRNCVCMNTLDSLPNPEEANKMRRGAEFWFNPVVAADELPLATEFFQKRERKKV